MPGALAAFFGASYGSLQTLQEPSQLPPKHFIALHRSPTQMSPAVSHKLRPIYCLSPTTVIKHYVTRISIYSCPLNGLIPFGTSGLFRTMASTFSIIPSSIFSIISNAVSCSSSCWALEHPRMTVPVFDIFAMYASASWMTPVSSSDWARAVRSRTF